MLTFLRNLLLNRGRYKTDPRAVVISCFFNPQNSPYRLLAFQKWYRSIKHLNHRIVECLIGPDAKPQLPPSPFITQVTAESLLWHKEALLNNLVAALPPEFQYVFWVDADVLFTNNNWLVEGVRELQTSMLIQPFEYCVHLEKNQLKPDFDVDKYRSNASDPELRHKRLWRSFCSNTLGGLSGASDYNVHGHVGFAWGARREILDSCPLYDRALIGGADHIIAHAGAGHIPHPCIVKSFADDLHDVEEWSRRFYSVVRGRLGFVRGDLYHIWHGDVGKRQYLKRIQDFTPQAKAISQKDDHGLYASHGTTTYVRNYFRSREVPPGFYDFAGLDADFLGDMGYLLADAINLFGPSNYDAPAEPEATPADNEVEVPELLPMPAEDTFS